MNLETLYEQVCKARPDAVVHLLSVPKDGWGWKWDFKDMDTNIAEAIITRVWWDLLPDGHSVIRGSRMGTPRWYVSGVDGFAPIRDTPIDAIAAYLLKELI